LGPFFPIQRIGIGDLPGKGENASHKPVLPLPALVGWGAGRAVSGEAQGTFSKGILLNCMPSKLNTARERSPQGWSQQLYPSCPPFLLQEQGENAMGAWAKAGRGRVFDLRWSPAGRMESRADVLKHRERVASPRSTISPALRPALFAGLKPAGPPDQRNDE